MSIRTTSCGGTRSLFPPQILGLDGEIASRARNGLGPVLGAREFALARVVGEDLIIETASRPKNQQAYDLFLQAMAIAGQGKVKQSRAMLEQSLALDSG
jgi:hypothetical protein